MLSRAERDRWAAVAAQPSAWPERLSTMAALVPPGSTVLDVGAGSRELRGLGDWRSYTALDCVSVADIVCDLDDRPLPPLPHHDVAVVAGVLEHLARPLDVLRWLRLHCGLVLFSYDHSIQRCPTWRSDVQREQFMAIWALPVSYVAEHTIYALSGVE